MSIRSLWPHEERDFLPWLVVPNNLAELSRVVGTDLEVRGREVHLGAGSRADLICEYVDPMAGRRSAIVEAQLTVGDPSHFARLLRYRVLLESSPGYAPVGLLVWIAAGFKVDDLLLVERQSAELPGARMVAIRASALQGNGLLEDAEAVDPEPAKTTSRRSDGAGPDYQEAVHFFAGLIAELTRYSTLSDMAPKMSGPSELPWHISLFPGDSTRRADRIRLKAKRLGDRRMRVELWMGTEKSWGTSAAKRQAYREALLRAFESLRGAGRPAQVTDRAELVIFEESPSPLRGEAEAWAWLIEHLEDFRKTFDSVIRELDATIGR